MTVTATKIDSSHESGKNFITWAWPASTSIIYNKPVQFVLLFLCFSSLIARRILEIILA
jgi:hypothetical protein